MRLAQATAAVVEMERQLFALVDTYRRACGLRPAALLVPEQTYWSIMEDYGAGEWAVLFIDGVRVEPWASAGRVRVCLR